MYSLCLCDAARLFAFGCVAHDEGHAEGPGQSCAKRTAEGGMAHLALKPMATMISLTIW
jgi:hypothetical protein